MYKVLVIDDEENILELIKFNLKNEGFMVFTSLDGKSGVELARLKTPDLIILDIMLPDISGHEVCRRLSSSTATSSIPIIILSASSKIEDKVFFLERFADDYITKPFSIRELIARVKSFLRKSRHDSFANLSQLPTISDINKNKELHCNMLKSEISKDNSKQSKEIKIKDVVLDLEKLCVKTNDKLVYLTSKEFELLKLLISNPGRIFNREQLMNTIWNIDPEKDTRTIDVHIRYLRQKIEVDPAKPKYIITVRGVGYKFST